MRVTRLIAAISILLLCLATSCLADTVLVNADPAARIHYNTPAWSPDGRSIAYVAASAESTTGSASLPTIYLATQSAGHWKHKVLVTGADWPVWSPDGKRLAFNRRGLSVMDTQTGKTRRFTKDKPQPEADGMHIDYPLSWSPNGRYLLCTRALYEGSYGFLIDTHTRRTLKISVGDESAWTVHNTLLTAVPNAPYYQEHVRLEVVDPAHRSSRVIVKDLNVERPFVPRGSGYGRVWVRKNASEGEGIYRVHLNTGMLTKLLSLNARELYWSPDGEQIAFLADLPKPAGEKPEIGLYLGSIHDPQFKILSTGLSPSGNWHDRTRQVGWSPDGKSIAYVTSAGDIRIISPAPPNRAGSAKSQACR